MSQFVTSPQEPPVSGGTTANDDTQGVQHPVWEVAHEHRTACCLLASAENGLLLWEPGAAVSLDDREALVQEAGS